MTAWTLLSAIIAPAGFWLGYLYYKDRVKPEPLTMIGLAYLLGIGSGYLGLKAYEVAEWFGASADPFALAESHKVSFLFYCLAIIGVLEELAKFLPFYFVCLKFKAFDEAIDGFVYASAVALGFASYENLLLIGAIKGPELYGRAFASPLTHTIFASVWGYSCAWARINGKPLFGPALLGFLVAAVFHGLYDFLVLAAHPLLRPIPATTILLAWLWRIRAMERCNKATAATLIPGRSSPILNNPMEANRHE
ncbi:MAG: PrsW family intramembrane metalloprotease [Verrucomicrobia bacterium]|nr:PrsW family intramembrane metalloprotease [Verrucomicrobiota bacterium]